MWLLAALIIIPIIEIGLFIEIGGWIGLWPTLGVVVLTAFAGAFLLRMQGFAALNELQERLAAGKDPTETIAHGAMILFAGGLLLTPGFFTDAVGFALLVPQIRAFVFAQGRKRIGKRMHGRVFVAGAAPRRQPPPDEPVIEGEWEEAPGSRTRDRTSKWARPPDGDAPDGDAPDRDATD